jgi:hypothetical protein
MKIMLEVHRHSDSGLALRKNYFVSADILVFQRWP